MKGGLYFEVICKECGQYAIKKWNPDMKMTDIKEPCPRCGGMDWADRIKPEGTKLENYMGAKTA
jgi:hypothetical protein